MRNGGFSDSLSCSGNAADVNGFMLVLLCYLVLHFSTFSDVSRVLAFMLFVVVVITSFLFSRFQPSVRKQHNAGYKHKVYLQDDLVECRCYNYLEFFYLSFNVVGV